jgi:hypothetical protein
LTGGYEKKDRLEVVSKEPKGAKAKAETRKTSCGKVKAKK